jgi:hypothetical protein
MPTHIREADLRPRITRRRGESHLQMPGSLVMWRLDPGSVSANGRRRKSVIEVHWTEVDGVTTVWVDSPAPLKASLLFRTGRADETLVEMRSEV